MGSRSPHRAVLIDEGNHRFIHFGLLHHSQPRLLSRGTADHRQQRDEKVYFSGRKTHGNIHSVDDRYPNNQLYQSCCVLLESAEGNEIKARQEKLFRRDGLGFRSCRRLQSSSVHLASGLDVPVDVPVAFDGGCVNATTSWSSCTA